MNFLAFRLIVFRKIWQTDSRYFTLVRACFSGKSIRTFFCSSKKHKFVKIEKIACTNLLFWCVKFVSCRMPCGVKILEDFTDGNSRKSQIKPLKKAFVWAFIIQD